MTDKIKVTKQEIDDIYEITEPTQPDASSSGDKAEETEPEFLTEEQQEQDDQLRETINWDEETKE